MGAASSATGLRVPCDAARCLGGRGGRRGPRRRPVARAGCAAARSSSPTCPTARSTPTASAGRRAALGRSRRRRAVRRHGRARVQFPPPTAPARGRRGLRPWAGLNCRDRNRVALEGELLALADVGAAVHCVTGDHTELGHRPDAQPVFDLDSTRLTALARGRARSSRWPRTRSPRHSDAAAGPCRREGHAPARTSASSTTPGRPRACSGSSRRPSCRPGAERLVFLACVPLVASREGVALIRTFTGLALPPGFVEAIDGGARPLRRRHRPGRPVRHGRPRRARRRRRQPQRRLPARRRTEAAIAAAVALSRSARSGADAPPRGHAGGRRQRRRPAGRSDRSPRSPPLLAPATRGKPSSISTATCSCLPPPSPTPTWTRPSPPTGCRTPPATSPAPSTPGPSTRSVSGVDDIVERATAPRCSCSRNGATAIRTHVDVGAEHRAPAASRRSPR